MVELADLLPRVKNFNVAVAEEGGKVIFLYKIMPGGVDKSYGIHVAQLAGLPKAVVHRAQEVLTELESDKWGGVGVKRRGKKEAVRQLSFLEQKSPLAEELEKLDINSLTPLEALTVLYELQKKAKEGRGQNVKKEERAHNIEENRHKKVYLYLILIAYLL